MHHLLTAVLPLLSVAAAATAPIQFEAPSIAGTTGFPSDYQGFGEQSRHVLGKNGNDGWRGSTDGGRSWKAVTLGGQQDAIWGDAPGQHSVVPFRSAAAGMQQLHNMGNVSVVGDKDAGYTAFSSTFVQVFEYGAGEAGAFSTRRVNKHVRFQGLPEPVTCGNPKHLFGCPFRTDGIGHVALPDGALLMSIVVYWSVHPTPSTLPQQALRANVLVQ